MSTQKPSPKAEKAPEKAKEPKSEHKDLPEEKGGFENRPEPTRFGDWDVNGRCSDF
ncbi:MAG: DUF1674 domain-containing protein [Alphaproteobacteria bacterium]|nr:DUF1674 domain-containing protein [Alphaproteobacteria bacterium]